MQHTLFLSVGGNGCKIYLVAAVQCHGQRTAPLGIFFDRHKQYLASQAIRSFRIYPSLSLRNGNILWVPT